MSDGDKLRDSDRELPYPDVPERADYPAIERAVLATWEREDTFRRSVESRPAGEHGENEFVFYDGPPFANGLPHYGHILTGYVKDVVPRYQTMRGRRVERRFGWDCHGLPAEIEAEQELGVSGRRAITEFGISKFNDYCRTSVLRYTKEWEDYVRRQARWVDFSNDYKTMDLSYMESVMWAFKRLWEKGLIYEANRVMPYSWGAETPLSNFEIRLDDATRPRQDPAITVRFTLVPESGDPGPMDILAWTTTPWTLPSNLALAVGADLDYAIFEEDGRHYILGAATVEKYEQQLARARRVGTVKGSELVGRRYEPLFPYFADRPDAFRILAADFVDTSEGTGVVHLAPGFGEEDQKACEQAGIEMVVPVDDSGRFTPEVPDWAGMNVFDANPKIIEHLKAAGRVVRHDTYVHNYPHCWRTDTPIIYKAVPSWYVAVTRLRDRLIELNRQINWIPEHVRDGQFGKWLEGVRDWSISRNRFWGSPIPVWKSDDPRYPRIDVYGSLDELERDFGVRPEDLHRPYIDELTRPNPDDPTGRSTMRRVPEVLDCWFESGSMPFAQVHYPFENVEWFEHHFPGDFIVEYIAQTRGWFYTLHVLACALFDKPAFRNCMCHGVVLDETGRKLSKRLRNYPDPEEVFETHGSDALRWYLISSPVLRGLDLRIDREGKGIAEVVRSVLDPIWNAFRFFTLYANVERRRCTIRTDSTHVLDRYILSKCRQLIENVTERMDGYDLAGACQEIQSFTEALNNWYIRRSRDRFWGTDPSLAPSDRDDAFDTLYTVLVRFMQVVAPFLPMLGEHIWRSLVGGDSVHLTDWPDPAEFPDDRELVAGMDLAREVCSAALAIRSAHGLRVRLPLPALSVAGPESRLLADFTALIADEVNVRRVDLLDTVEGVGSFVLRPKGAVIGPRLGHATQEIMRAAREGRWERNPDGSVTVAGHVLSPDEFELTVDTGGAPSEAIAGGALLVSLDTNVTDDLRAEGWARDLVRHIQQTRKSRQLHVTDRIHLTIWAPADLNEALAAHDAMIREQVLASDIRWIPDEEAGGESESREVAEIEGVPVSYDFSVTD
ncbi:MAG: isoleucine--tRNA ligase [Acidimicrobiales bacterium]|nr:MAG: isoleucine--tRNA ligase [Acidimicrobiales bacterium]